MTNFTLGSQTINFGITATVVGRHEATGSLILEAPGIGRWLADPAKCQPVGGQVAHRSGLVTLG